MDTFDISVCQDCIPLIVNGDVPEDRPDLVSEIDAEWPDYYLADRHCEGDWTLSPPGDCDVCDGWGCYAEFSRSRCDGCGSSLAGSRHPAAALPFD